MMPKKPFVILCGVAILVMLGVYGCYYNLDDEKHPTGPDRTGVQGWKLYVTVNPSTVPANGTATMNCQVKFWNLDDKSGIASQDVYLSSRELSGAGASPRELKFADGSVTHMVRTNGLGLADITLYAGYIQKGIVDKNFVIWGEATVDYDNNALSFYDSHSVRLYNPYYDGKATPTPKPGKDTTVPTAAFYWVPDEPEPGEQITFKSTSSDNGDQAQIIEHTWYFPGDRTYSGREVRHTFDDAGSYTVRLVVEDDDGDYDSVVQTVEVGDPE